MKNLGIHFSSEKADWETPEPFYRLMDKMYGPFTLDVCASPDNAKCERYYTEADNGLVESWAGEVCWMNPPYGDEIPLWVEKAHRESSWALVVGLIPARTSPPWWHDHVMYADQILLVAGRIRFVGAANCAPFPSAVAIWRPPGRLTRAPLVTSLELAPYYRGGKRHV